MIIFTTLSVVIWFSTGTPGIFATLIYVFTMRVVIYDILITSYFTKLYDNYCYIIIENFPKKFSPCSFQVQLSSFPLQVIVCHVQCLP